MKSFVATGKTFLKHLLGLRPDAPLFLFRQKKLNEIATLQTEEAIFLYGLVSVLKPKLAVEFGFLYGGSAAVILSAMNGCGRLHSFDVSEAAKQAATLFSIKKAGFVYHHKSQASFEAADVQNEVIGFVLMDASHNLEMNIATFKKVEPLISDEAVLMIHDTGLWQRKHMRETEFAALPLVKHRWLDDERLAHQVDERRFVNWLTEQNGWVVLNIGSSTSLRNGFSLITRNRPLEV